jgi:hypothetical protein
MFQYAFGRALAVRTGRPLVLETSHFGAIPGSNLELACFRLGRQRVRSMPYPAWRLRTTCLRGLRAFGIEPLQLIHEPGLRFSDVAAQVRRGCILEGFWQSERYFESIAAQLREEFTFALDQDPRSAECMADIRRKKAIGLHVRRGDYATPEGETYHGTCPKAYYDAALKIAILRLGGDRELFVFSDDIPWTRQNMKFELPTTYVDWNVNRAFEDLRLMSSCHALIMANSTFSWWGGWLMPHSDKVVVAPRRWYSAPEVVSDLPESPWLIAI